MNWKLCNRFLLIDSNYHIINIVTFWINILILAALFSSLNQVNALLVNQQVIFKKNNLWILLHKNLLLKVMIWECQNKSSFVQAEQILIPGHVWEFITPPPPLSLPPYDDWTHYQWLVKWLGIIILLFVVLLSAVLIMMLADVSGPQGPALMGFRPNILNSIAKFGIVVKGRNEESLTKHGQIDWDLFSWLFLHFILFLFPAFNGSVIIIHLFPCLSLIPLPPSSFLLWCYSFHWLIKFLVFFFLPCFLPCAHFFFPHYAAIFPAF